MEAVTLVEKIHSLILDNLPVKRKKTPAGWMSFDCVQCDDRRGRAGVIISGPIITYHCFNCGFKTGWRPGNIIGGKCVELIKSLGGSSKEIREIQMLCIRHSDVLGNLDERTEIKQHNIAKMSLPSSAVDIKDLPDNHAVKLYAKKRGIYGLYPLYFFDELAYRQRLVIPFYYGDDIVGWTGRHIGDDKKAKYLTKMGKKDGYVFNINKLLDPDRKIIIVCEGIIDAIKVDGVAIMTNSISDKQKEIFKKVSKTKDLIFCPDRDMAGKKMVEQAIAMNWRVSFPKWNRGCKDADEASEFYGRLSTVASVIQHAIDNSVHAVGDNIETHVKKELYFR